MVTREKVIGTVVVVIAVLGFLRCVEGLWLKPGDDWGGYGGYAGAVFDGGTDGEVGGTGGDGGTSGAGGASGAGGTTGAVCGDAVCADGEDLTNCSQDCDHDLVLVVDAAITGTMSKSFDGYLEDLEAEGRLARVEAWGPGTVESLKSFLFEQVDRYGVEAALLVGNLPAAFYEHRVVCLGWDRLGRCVMYEYEEFPTDVYLQDRNAVWGDADGNGLYDSHGDFNLEIVVSRLQTLPHPLKCIENSLFPDCPEAYDPNEEFYASEACLQRCPSRLQSQPWQDLEFGDAECCGPYFLRRYFERLHAYRTEGTLVGRSAMVFADDDFVHMVQPTGLQTSYQEVETVTEASDTTLGGYLSRVTGHGREFVHHFLHSTVQNLYFYVCLEWDSAAEPAECARWGSSRIHRTQIGTNPFASSYDVRVSFANMYNCHASRFTEPNLGMAFTLQTDFGLATVGNTRKGGMHDATVFHSELAQGNSWGESYRRWYNEVGKHDDRWFLGVHVTGDPMLEITGFEGGVASFAQPTKADHEPVETPTELTATDPPETFEDYKRRNPQFFEN